VFTSLYRYGIFNADPHPGNYLFHEDGTVTFLDFGCVKRFTPERVSVMSALVDAALSSDAHALLRAFIDVGLLADSDAEGLDLDRLLEFYRAALRDRLDEQPFTYTPESVAEIMAGTYQPLGQWSDVTGRLQMPKDLLFLNRIIVGASFILGHLHATADWNAIDYEIRHDGSPSTSLGHLEAEWRARCGDPGEARPARTALSSRHDGAARAVGEVELAARWRHLAGDPPRRPRLRKSSVSWTLGLGTWTGGRTGSEKGRHEHGDV
jgi:hypothetical protein